MRLLSGFIEKALARGATYTSLDAMKLFAIVNMTADHIGEYFFPQDLWWRAIGRITFPVWFFLVGYSRGRTLGTALYIYAFLLVADRPFFDDFGLLPLNALVTIIFCRWFLNFCEDRNFLPDQMPKLVAACFMLSLFTYEFFEYGTVAFMYALYGRMVVTKQKHYFGLLASVSFITFLMWQFAVFKFNWLQASYVALGTLWVVWWLATFSNDVVWQQWRQSRFKTFITVLSRNTLPYYFYHRLIFEILAAFLVGKGLHFHLQL
jgi:hypothetical protein